MSPDEINDIIEQYKQKPNSEWRNKVISHLKDAYAAAVVLEGFEMTNYAPEENKGLREHLNASNGNVCTCPMYPAAKDIHCAVHGGM